MLLVPGAGIALWFGVLSPGRSQADTGATPQQTLTAKAREYAANNEDTAPLAGTGVKTTLSQAIDLVDPGDQVLPDDAAVQSEDVYAVQLTGDFTGAEAKTPSTATAPPRGSTLRFLTDSNFDVVGWGLTDSTKDLSQVGAAFPIS